MKYFNNIDLSADEKRTVAFQTVVGLRDAFSLAAKKQQPPTYEQALQILYDLDIELYTDVINLITNKNDNDIVKYYKEEAQLQSIIENKEIEPHVLISKEINRLDNLKTKANLPKDEIKFIAKKIAQLYSGLENLKPRGLSENRILNRDYSKIDRSHYFAEKIFENDFYVDYKLPHDGILRVRLLHPDKPEQITGADLIYEQYDITNNKVRFVFLQYKTWDDGVLYFSQSKNLGEQLTKMSNTLCDAGFCQKPKNEKLFEDYRFPYCCGFLRPTDKLQHNDSKMISSGLHLPVCKVKEVFNTSVKLEKKDFKRNTLNHKHFEELFNLNLLGSRWISTDELEEFYREKKIIFSDETIKIYAREMIEIKAIK